MKLIKNPAIGLALASLLAVSACGDEVENPSAGNEVPAGGGTAEPAGNSPEQAPKSVDLMTMSGRWVSPKGSVGENMHLLMDLTSQGDVSIEVRQVVDGKEAILEEARGKAKVEGSVISGTAPKGPGVHGTLSKYETWTLDGSGNIKGKDAPQALKMTKE